MTLTLSIDLKPLSMNLLFKHIKIGNNVRRAKSAKYIDFKNEVDRQLFKHKGVMSRFAREYSDKNNYVVAEYMFYFPGVITKKGLISKTAGDTSNLIKSIEDCIFEHLPDMNDSCIIGVTATKIEAETPRMIIRYTLKELNTIL